MLLQLRRHNIPRMVSFVLSILISPERLIYLGLTAITSTLEAQHATFIALASRTAAVDAELQKIKALYIQLWRAKTGSMRDPFNDLDRGAGGEFGLQSLSGK